MDYLGIDIFEYLKGAAQCAAPFCYMFKTSGYAGGNFFIIIISQKP